MCGICGIYGYSDRSEILNMMSALNHRGPDSSGAYLDDNVGLGHCRLSIIDLSPLGNQPMSNEDNMVYMVVNGEIYNYKELRVKLLDLGHKFVSNSDSEVIIHAYEEWGDDFVTTLRGMFALALYDRAKKKLLLARDPIGKKPLYYHADNGRLTFASEIKALFEAGVPKLVNYKAIPSYLIYQYVMGLDTIFDKVYRLPAGTMLTVCPDRIKLERYWELTESVWVNDISEEKGYIDCLRDLLEESVRLRLQSDVPIGAFLSGGVDSSATTALWRLFLSGKLHTFTASFETNSEARFAKEVSEYLDTVYHEVLITADMVVGDIGRITWHHDEPLGDAATINNYYLAREAKKYTTVILAGEGGDELFGGYPWYKYVPLISAMNKVPYPVRRLLSSADKLLGNGDPTRRFNKWHRMLEFPLQKSLVDMQLYPTTAMSAQNLKWLTGVDYRNNGILVPEMRDPLNKMLGLDCLNLLQKFLMKADKSTMSHAIEERLPLLDTKVIEYAFSLPPRMKRDKYALRKAVEDLLPKDITWRKKQGFGTPLAHWLNSPKMRALAIDRLHGDFLIDICNHDALYNLAAMLKNGGLKHSNIAAFGAANVIWSLLALQVWYDIFFGG